VECAPEIPSLLQKLWDKHKENSHIFLILCGSHFHMMHEQFVSRQKPLYGRVTESLVLDEIAPEDLGLFLPRYSPEQIVETYSVIGGIPGYLELWDDRTPVFRNIEQRILSGTTFFSQEATLLIQDEIAEPRTYLAILEAMGAKRCIPSELARTTGIPSNQQWISTELYLISINKIRFHQLPNLFVRGADGKLPDWLRQDCTVMQDPSIPCILLKSIDAGFSRAKFLLIQFLSHKSFREHLRALVFDRRRGRRTSAARRWEAIHLKRYSFNSAPSQADNPARFSAISQSAGRKLNHTE
jgi:hypothetical protein